MWPRGEFVHEFIGQCAVTGAGFGELFLDCLVRFEFVLNCRDALIFRLAGLLDGGQFRFKFANFSVELMGGGLVLA